MTTNDNISYRGVTRRPAYAIMSPARRPPVTHAGTHSETHSLPVAQRSVLVQASPIAFGTICLKIQALVLLHSMPVGHSVLTLQACEQYLPLCCGSPTQSRDEQAVPTVQA